MLLSKFTIPLLIAAFTLGQTPVKSQAAETTGEARIINVSRELAVRSNGSRYYELVPLGNIHVATRLTIRGVPTRKIRSWLIEYVVSDSNGQKHGERFTNNTRIYPVGSRPFEIDEVVDVQIVAASLQTAAVEACNNIANRLRSEGKTDTEIFSQNRRFRFHVSPRLRYKLKGNTGYNFGEITIDTTRACGHSP